MTISASLTFLGDPSQWSEDVIWLTENRASDALNPLPLRLRWMHVYLERAPGGVLARIHLDIAGSRLFSVCALRTSPQAAVCAAFDQLKQEIQQKELIPH